MTLPSRALAPLAAVVLLPSLLLAAPAVAADSPVDSLAALQAALADCATAPHTITLEADIAAPAQGIIVGCDTTIDLGIHDLSLHNIRIGSGVEFEVTGPTDGSGGTLTADASGTSYVSGIRTTRATFIVSGGTVDAFAGINASAVGGDLAESGGALRVDGGVLNAYGHPGGYGSAVGGGYLSGAGGTVTVTGGALNASATSVYGVAIGGGGAGASGFGGAGATVTVSGGTLTATSTGHRSVALGGGIGGLSESDRGGPGGTVTVGVGGELIASSPASAIGGGVASGLNGVGDFGSVRVDGVLRLPSGRLAIDPDPTATPEVVVASTGAILGSAASPTVGATISGTGLIENQGVIALAPPVTMVSGNNRLVTFDTADEDARIFAPSFATGYRTLPAPPAGTLWNTASDGSGAVFATDSSTAGPGTTDLFAVSPGSLAVSTDPGALTATAGEPYAFPVTALGVNGTALDPQPEISYSSTNCTIDAGRVFRTAGTCSISAGTVVQGIALTAAFDIEVVAGAPASLEVTPSATTVAQRGSLAFAVIGEDAYGNPVDTAEAVLTSSVATDEISGLTVTFPHASPHTITATLGEATGSVTIEVVPTPTTGGGEGEEEPGEGAEEPGSGEGELPDTGLDVQPVLTAIGAGMLLLAAGGLLLRTRRRTLG